MNYKAELQQNNLDLQGLIDMANELPEAGSEESVETCTVTLTGHAFMSKVIYQKLENGEITTIHAGGSGDDIIFENVVCGTLFCAFDRGDDLIPDYVTGNGTLEYVGGGLDAAIIKVNGDCSIHITNT